MTVQNKVYEGLAMAKPVITGDGPAVRAALTHGENVYLCRRADGADLAQAISILHDDAGLRRRLGEMGTVCTWRNSILQTTVGATLAI